MWTFPVKTIIVAAALALATSAAAARPHHVHGAQVRQHHIVKQHHARGARSGLVASINSQLATWVHRTGRCAGRELLATQYGRGDGTAGRPVACRGYGPFNPAGMTMASRIHRCGSVVSLTNPHTGQSATVTVTDYGPGTSAVIDVSSGAAAALGMTGRRSSSYLCEGGATLMAGAQPRIGMAAKSSGHRRAAVAPLTKIYARDINAYH